MDKSEGLIIKSLRDRYQRVVTELDFDDNDINSDYTDYMRLLRHVIKHKKIDDEQSQYCYEALTIFVTPYKRVLVEALLLSGATLEDIYKVFGIHTTVLDMYIHLMFDTEQLRTHLDKLYYVDQLPYGQEKELKLRALNLGPEFIFFRYANIVPKNKIAKEVMTRMFYSAAYRVMEANYNPMGSDISKEALQWSQTMIKCFEALNKMTVDNKSARDNMLKVLSNGGAFAGGATLVPNLQHKDKDNNIIDKNNIM